jgi:hypothetical protein
MCVQLDEQDRSFAALASILHESYLEFHLFRAKVV